MQHLTFFDDMDHAYSALQLRSSRLPRYAILHLDASKTDPFRLGVDHHHLRSACPQCSQHLYLAMPGRPSHGFRAAFPLRGRSARHSSMADVSSGCAPAEHPPRPQRLQQPQLPQGRGSVSAAAGVEDSIIRRAGRWRSDAFNLYVRHASLDSLVAANARL